VRNNGSNRVSRRTARKASEAIAAPLRATRTVNGEDIIMREKVSDERRRQQAKLRIKMKSDRISKALVLMVGLLRVLQ
jgi:hypothetical protein